MKQFPPSILLIQKISGNPLKLCNTDFYPQFHHRDLETTLGHLLEGRRPRTPIAMSWPSKSLRKDKIKGILSNSAASSAFKEENQLSNSCRKQNFHQARGFSIHVCEGKKNPHTVHEPLGTHHLFLGVSSGFTEKQRAQIGKSYSKSNSFTVSLRAVRQISSVGAFCRLTPHKTARLLAYLEIILLFLALI